MLTAVAYCALLCALAHSVRASAASAHLIEKARKAAPRESEHQSNARDVLRAARQGASADVVRAAVAQHAAQAHAQRNHSEAEFEVLRHRVPELSASAWLRLSGATAALVALAYATYQTVAAVRRYRGTATQLSVPIDYKSVKRLLKSAQSQAP